MTIDWVSFTPWAALSGGLLIGSAAAVFLLFNGRIAGISGVLGGFGVLIRRMVRAEMTAREDGR